MEEGDEDSSVPVVEREIRVKNEDDGGVCSVQEVVDILQGAENFSKQFRKHFSTLGKLLKVDEKVLKKLCSQLTKQKGNLQFALRDLLNQWMRLKPELTVEELRKLVKVLRVAKLNEGADAIEVELISAEQNCHVPLRFMVKEEVDLEEFTGPQSTGKRENMEASHRASPVSIGRDLDWVRNVEDNVANTVELSSEAELVREQVVSGGSGTCSLSAAGEKEVLQNDLHHAKSLDANTDVELVPEGSAPVSSSQTEIKPMDLQRNITDKVGGKASISDKYVGGTDVTDESSSDSKAEGDSNMDKKRTQPSSADTSTEMADNRSIDFNCEICGEKYHNRYLLGNHIRKHTGEKVHECSICQKRYFDLSNMKNHQKTHLDERAFECQFCKKRYANSTYLKSHIQFMHVITEKRFKCDVCYMKFKTKQYLSRHKKNTHDPQKRRQFLCVFCDKGFPNRDQFDRHLRTHIEERPEFCKFCPAELSTKPALGVHLERHQPAEEKKMAECALCPKKFTNVGALLEHLRTHTGEKPYKCETCQRRFHSRSHLKSHIRVHSDLREFKCTICTKSFKRADDLTTHHRTVHAQERKYICQICDRGFLNKINLADHSGTHLPEQLRERPYECTSCDKRFFNKANFRSHQRLHEAKLKHLKCNLCNLQFNRTKTFENHVEYCGKENPFRCSYCGFNYTSKTPLNNHVWRTHLRRKKKIETECIFCKKLFFRWREFVEHCPQHTEERPHLCKVCAAEFKMKYTLQKHSKIHQPTRRKDFKCAECSRAFEKPRGLIVHLRTHKSERDSVQ